MSIPIYGSERAEYDDTFRPTTLTPIHSYNLNNQSWGIPRTSLTYTNDNPVTRFHAELGSYPSNADTVWIGLQFRPITGTTTPTEYIYPNLYRESEGSGIKAAKGYFIIDAIQRGASREVAYAYNNNKYPTLGGMFPALPEDRTTRGASIVCEFAGRVFFAGFGGINVGSDIRSPNLSNHILFSQLVKNDKDIVKCYQEGDPTSREGNDLVDTDGGFIRISGLEVVVGLINLGTALMVIATNGVWAITGGSDYGFSATNYKVDKLSSYGGISRGSIVEDGSRAFYWAEDGIYVIAKDQFGVYKVDSITENTIQSFYELIPNTSKANVKGNYDQSDKTIRWIYKTGTPFTSTSRTYELVLNLGLSAFYKNRIYNTPDNSIEVTNLFSSTLFNTVLYEEDVVVGGVQVTVGGVDVVIQSRRTVNNPNSTRYLVFKRIDDNNSQYTFASYKDEKFRDWPEVSPVDAKAFVLTGAATAGDSSVPKQTPYLTMHFRRTESGVSDGVPNFQSSCLFRAQWDWANTVAANKWTPLMEAYRYRKALFVSGPSDPYDSGFEVVSSKNKIRGRGKAFALYLETTPLKDCNILGWNINVNGNQVT